jgi:hypothetical protein
MSMLSEGLEVSYLDTRSVTAGYIMPAVDSAQGIPSRDSIPLCVAMAKNCYCGFLLQSKFTNRPLIGQDNFLGRAEQ